MKAIIRDAYGSVDVLRLADIDQSVAGDADVLVRVHAAGVDQGVWHLMTGTPYVMRLAGFGIRAPKNPLLGYDVAGRVEAVGARVTELGLDRLTVEHRLVSAKFGAVAAEGQALIVAFDYARGQKAPIPDVLRARIEETERSSG